MIWAASKYPVVLSHVTIAGDVFALTANPNDPTSLGTYTCEAVNCMGRAVSSSRVRVLARDSLGVPSR